MVVAKVVERGFRAEAARTRSTAAKAISEANQVRDPGGLVDPTVPLVPEEEESDLASASKQLFGEDKEKDAGVTPGAGTEGDEGEEEVDRPTVENAKAEAVKGAEKPTTDGKADIDAGADDADDDLSVMVVDDEDQDDEEEAP